MKQATEARTDPGTRPKLSKVRASNLNNAPSLKKGATLEGDKVKRTAASLPGAKLRRSQEARSNCSVINQTTTASGKMKTIICTIKGQRLRERREYAVILKFIISNIFEVVEDVKRVSIHTARPRRTGARLGDNTAKG